MNEIANFADGEHEWEPAEDDILNRPPYVPAGPGQLLANHTIRMDAVYYGNLTDYYVHAFYGFLESQTTFNYLKKTKELPYILSRSTFYGSGKFVFHWNGDNGATWDFLAYSIPGVMNLGLFGIPMVGPDMCGFEYHSTTELCSRWYQVGTLYPFSRNHNIKWGTNHEPYALGPTLLETARVTLKHRYSLLKHFYSLFLTAKGSGTVYKPMFYEFPEEEKLYDHRLSFVESQHLVGPSLMVAPVVKEGVDSVDVFFPKATWYDFKDGEVMQKSHQDRQVITYPSPLNATVPMFIRGGYIFGKQEVEGISNTEDLNNVFEVVIALEKKEKSYHAEGPLLGINNFDEANIVKKCQEKNCVYTVAATFDTSISGYNLDVNFHIDEKIQGEEVYVSSLTVYGAENLPSSSTLKNVALSISEDHTTKIENVEKKGSTLKITFDKPVLVTAGRKINVHEKIVIGEESCNKSGKCNVDL